MLKTRYIPENVLQGKRFLGFRKRNLAEGVIWAFIAFLIIGSIPFVPKVRWIITICLAILLILMNGIGIRGMSYTQALVSLYHYKKYLKSFSYRRLNYADDAPEELFETINGRQKVKTIRDNSTIERAKRLIRI